MKIAPELVREIIADALQQAPNECCGVVAVRPGPPATAVGVWRATNAARSPLRFEIDGREALSIVDELERQGLELGAIYHSHTRSPPYPSQTDINFAANWPGVEWIIVGLADRAGEAEVRSYLIDGAQVHEVAI